MKVPPSVHYNPSFIAELLYPGVCFAIPHPSSIHHQAGVFSIAAVLAVVVGQDSAPLVTLLAAQHSRCDVDEQLYGRSGLLHALLLVWQGLPTTCAGLLAELREAIDSVFRQLIDTGGGGAQGKPLTWVFSPGVSSKRNNYLGAAHGDAGILMAMVQARVAVSSDLWNANKRLLRRSVDYLLSRQLDDGNFPKVRSTVPSNVRANVPSNVRANVPSNVLTQTSLPCNIWLRHVYVPWASETTWAKHQGDAPLVSKTILKFSRLTLAVASCRPTSPSTSCTGATVRRGALRCVARRTARSVDHSTLPQHAAAAKLSGILLV